MLMLNVSLWSALGARPAPSGPSVDVKVDAVSGDDAGATGTMTSAMIPDLIKPILAAHAAGDRREAAALYARVLPIINYENRQCGLRSAKAVMKAGGVIKSDAVRHPLTPLHPQTREGLLELARELDPLALRWGK